MSAVVSLPHGFSVHYELKNPALQEAVRSLPFTVPLDAHSDSAIIVVDSLETLGRYNFEQAVLIDTSCAPMTVPVNTLVLPVAPNDNFASQLIAMVTAISQGNGHCLMHLQNTYQDQLAGISGSLEEGIFWTDGHLRILNFSTSAATMLKQRSGKLVGQGFFDLISCEEDDLPALLMKRAGVNATDRLEIAGTLNDGSKIYLMVGIRRLANNRYQVNLSDVSDQRAADKRFIQLANYDPMTGLANRGLLFEFLGHSTGRSKRNNGLMALMLLDLEHFNRVSDVTGEQMGDELLKRAAERIRSLLQDQDMIARWGGDELAIVVEDLEQPEAVGRIAERIVSVLTNPFVIEGKDHYLSPSIGIAVYPEADKTVNGLIHAASTAMFEAKKSDVRNTYRFYQAKLQKFAEERAEVEEALRRALDHDEFEVYYQPKVSITGERVSGFEALLRWNHPDWKTVSPGVYIPIAERCGLIGQIGDWVLRQACHQMAAWRQEFKQMADCSIAVNVSTKQLEDDFFVGKVAAILEESGLEAEKLEIEITESSVMEDPESAIKLLNSVRDLGVRISIDDFGTGYSSLSYLRKLPIDCIKIDRSFVMDVGVNASTESIIHAILVMSAKLGVFNVAEGIETVEQMSFFEGTHCDLLQGYLFSKPLSRQEIEMMFSAAEPVLHSALVQLSHARRSRISY